MARGPQPGAPPGRPALLLLLLPLAAGLWSRGAAAQEPRGLSLHPPYFNLAEGTRITASATCGEDAARAVSDLYCKLVGGPVSGDPSQTIQGQYCDVCSQNDGDRAHPITNAIDGTERWWQSPPLSRSTEFNQVNVTLDLGQLFHVAYVLIKFANSPRPDLWVLERSVDFGQTYRPWQYFASSKRDCIERFGQQSIERIHQDDDVICSTEYSRIVPLENGEVVVSLVNGRPGAMNFSYSPVLRDFTKATNIRLRFLRTNTLLGHLMGKALRDPTVTRRYYYSIKDISIGGRCVCNGHAEACNAQDPQDPYKLQCDCQHNTCGLSCDQCCPGYSQLPWKPATTYNANECEQCNCHRHSFDCYYDPEVERRRASLNIHGHHQGGGVCLNCQHHTTGVNCERCIPTYYRSPDHSIDSPLACSRCACESEFSDGTCEDGTGRCLCRPGFSGPLCDACAPGFLSFPQCYPHPTYPSNNNGEAKPAGEIINCECSAAGTLENSCRPDPRTRTCVCKAGFSGAHCDTCSPGHHGPACQACQCSGPGCLDGSCDSVTGHSVCRSGFHGYECDKCAPGYFNYPLCQLCGCSAVGSLPAGCDVTGHCLCRPEFTGARCDQCRSGYHSYPDCQECTCDPRTSLEAGCSPSGLCRCRPDFSGPSCDQCAPGYYGYPSCTPCLCSSEGSGYAGCEQQSGQCVCLPGVAGRRCDTCVHGAYGFPHCHAGSCHPAGSVQDQVQAEPGQCECRENVEGGACDRCKALFWNLSPDTPDGCSSCECNPIGTISGVAECAQTSGQCPCRPGVCSGTCSVCKDGFFNLQEASFFGCQGCQCDIGGAAGQSCGERNGRCRCRPNVDGPKCDMPRVDHYFPDLHHMRVEVEEGTVPDGRPVRFGFDPLEFEGFSWKGYAQMSSIQSRVSFSVSVGSPDLFRVVLHFVNRGVSEVRGRVVIVEDGRPPFCRNCSEQSKQIVFSPSLEPTFVNVPQNSFVEPFVLNPGTWTVVIEAEDVLLDYMVLLPSAYYEAPILQLRVTEPCYYGPGAREAQHCLLYRYLSLDAFPSISANDANCRYDNHLPRPCQVERITARHPDTAVCSGQELSVELRGRVGGPGDYVLVVEYASEEQTPQTLSVTLSTPGGRGPAQHRLTLLHCTYSFLCRVVAIDDQNRVAVFSLSADPEVHLTSDRASFFLHKVFLVPRDQFTMEYVDPKVHCISTHGQFSPDSSSCVPSRFYTPSDSLVLREGQGSSVQGPTGTPAPGALDPQEQRDQQPWTLGAPPPFGADSSEHVKLDRLQNAAVYSTRVHSLGRYVFILHYHQPLHPSYPVQVYINGGRIWQGHVNASFCPHGYGCRGVLVAESQIILDVTDHEVFLTVQIPEGKTLWLDYVLVVPESRYSSSYLSEEPLDRSYDFISSCGHNSFHIDPSSSSPFCLRSAVSLSSFFNNGALPCACHEAGAHSDACHAFGGQCRCRPHVIGRDCSTCATGYWGFPNCRPCSCGSRLCEAVTGACICPPRTLRPDCTACEPQTFGCHPVVGCEVCNCSRAGVTAPEAGCHHDNGQCRCKNNIIGRQCDRCEAGFHGYPNCRPCDCNEAGTEEDVCDSLSGQCLCKENVQGPRCDQCRVGTFHLDPTNPKGCTSCFCFGATDRCRSSETRRNEIMDMLGWVLVGADKQEVPVTTYPGQDLVEADLSDVPDVYQDLHWHAPKAYLGDKVSSYGGHLRYRLHTQTMTMRGDALSLPAETPRPDIILKGNQMTLVFMEREYSSPEEPHLGIVHLVEGSFLHAQTGNAVSREELMMVLVALASLQVRALHSQSAHSVSLRGAVLEGAAATPAGRHANNVEICMCPANYQGDSCQRCAPGFYRDTKGLFLGKCVPCNCNGHSDLCLDGSGICTSCQHNTAGDHCEECLGGFLGNNTLDGQSCSSCPCPLQVASNNFAMGCVQKSNRMQCLCMPGYAGTNCERCAPGFYGNPMVVGSSCQPCGCHDNTDPNMLFSDCHPLTGACLSCMQHTAGPHCESCSPGYHGDAIHAKNCTKCSCSACGTESCDPQTGQCLCKPGVTGKLCDRCLEGFYGYESCGGCHGCECGAAAALVRSCDPASGQCACQPGVSGPGCQQCAAGHWDYGPEGCKKCACKGGRCDPGTGACRCGPGLSGPQCDTCSHTHSVAVQQDHLMHCEACDSCVIVLLEDLETMDTKFLSVANQLGSLNASSMAWSQLTNLNATMEDVSRGIESYNSSLDDSRARAAMLEEEVLNLKTDITELENKAGSTGDRAADLTNSTEELHHRALLLLSSLSNMTSNIHDMMLSLNRSANGTESEEEEGRREQRVQEVEAMLREMRFRSCSTQRKMADRERTEAQKLLARVSQGLVARQTNTSELARGLRARLELLQQQMMDLREELNQGLNTTAQAAHTNQASLNALEDHQRREEELQAGQKEVEELLQMAEDDVAQVNELLAALHESKEEYERLAAQLDGARAPLADKVQDFAPAAAKIPLVERAEEHAHLLERMATNLTRLISGTNEDGFIGRALNASRAYGGIIRAVEEAELAANAAHSAATEAAQEPQPGGGRGDGAPTGVQNEALSLTAAALRNHSAELLEEAKEQEEQLRDLEPKVSDVRRRLVNARDKQEVLQKQLEEIQKDLNTTSDVAGAVAEAKRRAAGANSTAGAVLEALGPLTEQLERWGLAYGDANSTNQDMDHALTEANRTVSMLSETFPLLLKKLDRLQNHSAQMPNISENISRIRTLIEQARKAASKVSVSVKFNGSAGVQVRNPGNLADLAAYTSLKFFITLPEGARRRRLGDANKQFVFYLGNKDSSRDFLGMALEGRRLRWFFNVGGATADVLMQEDVKADGSFSNVVLERTLQFGGMSVSSESSDGARQVTKAHVEAEGDLGLLNLLPRDTVFYVGGYPPSFKLQLPPLQGCVELETLNEEVLSLYNFEKVFNLNTTQDPPCGRSKAVLTQQWVNDGAYFDGSGYAEVDHSEDSARMQRFEQEVKLLSHNGVLLMLHNQRGEFLCLAVLGGRLRVFYDFSSGLEELQPKEPDSAHMKISDAEPKALEIIILRSGKERVVVRNNRNTLFSSQFSQQIPPFSPTYYLGGVPQGGMPPGLQALFPGRGSLKGCFRNLKAMNSHIDLKRMRSSGVSFGCSTDLLVAREAHFSGRSYLDLDHSDLPALRDNFYAGFGFRTQQKNGLMLLHRAADGVCQVFLDQGRVVLRAGNSEVRSQKAFNDDLSHYVALYSNTNGLRLYVDDSLERGGDGGRSAGNGRSVAAATSGSFYLGGTPDQPTSNLTGCISNLFIKRVTGSQGVQNLLKVKENVNVPLDCPAAQKPQSILAAAPKARNKGKNRKPAGSRSRSTRESCQGEPSPPETGATHFSGSAHSHQRYDDLPRDFSRSPHISLGVRVNSSEGLVLHTAQQGGGAVMSLSVSEGHLVLLVEGGKRKASLRSRRKYSDNQWHTVFIKRDGDKISLVVDGINALSKKLPGGDKFRLSGPLYVGGAPLALLAPGAGGMVGCVRGLELNQVPAGTPSHSQGAAPCFLSLLHPGAYFSREGGHIAIDDAVVLGKDLEVRVEVRARSDSGLLLHAGTSEHFLNVVLNQGQVTVTVNSGSGQFSTSFTPDVSLCDGHWHTLSVMKRSSVLQIEVDGVSERGVGPKASRSAGGKHTLYLGGAPGGAVVPGLPAGLPSFHGCVRKASLNQRAVPLSKPLALHGAVGTQGCPHD